jgi:hypothetical protein
MEVQIDSFTIKWVKKGDIIKLIWDRDEYYDSNGNDITDMVKDTIVADHELIIPFVSKSWEREYKRR